MKRIFVAATRQNDGKTMVSLGLFKAFQNHFQRVAYMKPVGQQYRVVNGEKIDKDAVLMAQTYNLSDPLPDMSPIAIPRGFTTNYIDNPHREELVNRVQKSFDNLAASNDFVLIEGTGHAGVGSVFDMSNADVAKQLDAKVVIVSQGGIGKPIDEILMNKALFDNRGVEVVGAIINKVDARKYDKVRDIAERGLARHGLKVVGVIPLVHMLSKPSILEVAEDLDAEILTDDPSLMMKQVGKFIIGDQNPHNVLDVLNRNALLIVPGNRDGLITSALAGHLLEYQQDYSVAGMVFTMGIRPHKQIMELVYRSKVPAMLVKEDAFSVATRINNSIFKLRAEETDKIKTTQELVDGYVDVEQICRLL